MLRFDTWLLHRLLGGLLHLGLLSIVRPRGTAPVLVRATMLLHVVLSRKGLVALGAEGVLLAGMFLGVTCGMAGCGEEICAADLLGHWARVLVLLRLRLAVRGRRDGRHT